MHRMLPPALILLAALSGCRQEPDFDQRYRQTQQKIDAKAAAIDRELDAAASDAAAAGAGETAAPEAAKL